MKVPAGHVWYLGSWAAFPWQFVIWILHHNEMGHREFAVEIRRRPETIEMKELR